MIDDLCLYFVAEQDEDDEILSSSTTGRLWKAAFGRRGGQKFLDICLLKKAYMKALEGLTDGEQEPGTASSVTNSNVDNTISDSQDQSRDGDDDADLASRTGKRSMATGNDRDNDSHEMKRSKNSPTSSSATV